jgi:hypothetical protein
MLPGLAVFGLLAAVGVVPTLMLTWRDSEELVAEASRIYVFDRLPHHLAPLSLPWEELARRLGGHTVLLASLGLLMLGHQRPALKSIVRFAWGAALLAAVGFVVEIALWNQPLVAARLLRYYWFRLTDFGAPLALALCLTALIVGGLAQRRSWAGWLLTAAVVFAGWQVAHATRQRMLIPIPPADEKLHDFPAWVDACEWVAENTPTDAVFLTPRLNHSFKWRAGRPEVANRKDVPQDARSIIEWYHRIKDIYYIETAGGEEPLDSIGILGNDKVRELAQKYRADYVLMDRGQLLSLPIAFWNEEYVVYRIEDQNPGNGR